MRRSGVSGIGALALLGALVAVGDAHAQSATVTISAAEACASPGAASVPIAISVANAVPVRALQVTLEDTPDELEYVEAACTARAPGFTCSANEVNGKIVLLVVNLTSGTATIAAGTGPVATLTLKDNAPNCAVGVERTLALSDGQAAGGQNQALDVALVNGVFRCTASGECVVPPQPALSLGNVCAASGASTIPVDISLQNPEPVRAVQFTVEDVPDDLEYVEAACAARATGFNCSANEVGGKIVVLVVNLSSGTATIAAGDGPLVRLTLKDKAPACSEGVVRALVLSDVQVADAQSQALTTKLTNGSFRCECAGSCGDGTVQSGEQCDQGLASNGTSGSCCAGNCTFKSNSSVCRIANGVCDLPETCTGATATCPADVKKPDSTACADALFCNGAEACQAGQCQSGVAPCLTGQCNEAQDVCETCGDGALQSGEQCDQGRAANGTPASCCSIGCTFKAGGTECRVANGICDAAESCSGSAGVCPADGKKPNGTSCSDDIFCNGEEVCQGGSCNLAAKPCPGTCNEALNLCETEPPSPIKCRAAIIKGRASFVRAQATALAKCEEKIVKGKLPPGDCRQSADTAAAIDKSVAKFLQAIAKACGGKDKVCGTSDDNSLVDLGWNIGACPNFENGACNGAIANCADIATCLACIGEAATDAAVGIAYDALNPSDPKAEKQLNKCQVAIGKATTKFYLAKSKALAACWDKVNKGKANSPCPNPGDGKAFAAIAKAEAKQREVICKACGGADKLCNGSGDFSRADIGFPAQCPAATLPGGATCGGAVTTLSGVVDCLACVNEFAVDCADLAAVPAFAPYASECNPEP